MNFRAAAMSCRRYAQRSLVFLLSFLCLGLSGCMVLPSSDVNDHRISYSATPLFTLPDGQVAYLLQDCLQSFAKAEEPFRCGTASNHLAVRQAGWDLPAEVRRKLGERKPYSGFELDDVRQLSGARGHVRPASARHGTPAEFVGYFDGFGFVWLRPDGTGHWRHEVLNRAYEANTPFRPALVLRDGDDVWVFAERAAPCNEDVCRQVAPALGVPAESLPESLRGNFMVYHANLAAKTAYLQRLLPDELQRFLEERLRPQPPKGVVYETDFRTQPAVDIATFQAGVLCDIRSVRTEYIYFVMMAPLGSKHGEDSTRLRSCSTQKGEVNVGFPPAQQPALPISLSDDPQVHLGRSSYRCLPTPAAKMPQLGKGEHACSFVLRDPATQAVLAGVPYLIWLEQPGGKDLEVRGVSNAEGRTALVRSETPITLRRLRVSRRLAPAELARAAPILKGRAVTAEAVGVHWVRATDEHGIPGVPYRLTACTGQTWDDYTDAAGWTVAYDAPKGSACALRFQFDPLRER
jgi:hypothetical protein